MYQPVKKPVTPQHFIEISQPHMKEQVILPLEGWEVGLLHGIIRIALAHPGTQNLSNTSHLAIARWREFCLTVIGSWGFTPDEVAWLDSVEVDDAGRPLDDRTPGPTGTVIMTPETRARLTMEDAEKKYPSGIGKIDRGECPRLNTHPASCMFCPNGHMLECHYPKSCQEAECGHYTHGSN
jgi:hypothetical protein